MMSDTSGAQGDELQAAVDDATQRPAKAEEGRAEESSRTAANPSDPLADVVPDE
jgi:hypothetical protein